MAVNKKFAVKGKGGKWEGKDEDVALQKMRCVGVGEQECRIKCRGFCFVRTGDFTLPRL